jgi:hypothetical protein
VETVIEYLNKNVRNAQLIMKQAEISAKSARQVRLNSERHFYHPICGPKQPHAGSAIIESIRRRVRDIPRVVNLRQFGRAQVGQPATKLAMKKSFVTSIRRVACSRGDGDIAQGGATQGRRST